MVALKLTPGPEADRIVMGLRAIAVIGLAHDPAQSHHPHAAARDGRDGAGRRSVRRGQRLPAAGDRLGAARAPAARPRRSAAIVKTISTPAHPVDLDAGFSVNGWLAVLLTFVLARVFAEGALMREDLEGTV